MNHLHKQSCPPLKVGMYKRNTRRNTRSRRVLILKDFYIQKISTIVNFYCKPKPYFLLLHARAAALTFCATNNLLTDIEFSWSSCCSAIRLKNLNYTLKRCQEALIGFLLITNSCLYRSSEASKIASNALLSRSFDCTQPMYLTFNTKTSASLMTDTSNSRSATSRLKIAQTLLCILTPSFHAA